VERPPQEAVERHETGTGRIFAEELERARGPRIVHRVDDGDESFLRRFITLLGCESELVEPRGHVSSVLRLCEPTPRRGSGARIEAIDDEVTAKPRIAERHNHARKLITWSDSPFRALPRHQNPKSVAFVPVAEGCGLGLPDGTAVGCTCPPKVAVATTTGSALGVAVVVGVVATVVVVAVRAVVAVTVSGVDGFATPLG
jgi:hypothetical protein